MVLSPLPGIIAWSVIGYTAVLITGRLLLFRDTIADQFLNRVLLWCLVSLLLYRCTWTPGIASLAEQLALCCLVMMSVYVIGFARFWDADSDVDAIWRRQRSYRVAGLVSVIAILVAGARARAEGRSVDLGLDLEGLVVGIAFAVPMGTGASMLMWIGLREIRRVELVKERVFYTVLTVDCTYLLTNQFICATQLLTGWPDLGPYLPRTEFITVVCFLPSATFAAVPLATWLIESAGLGRSARVCRRLRPLWRDLTAAVPEVVLLADTDMRARTLSAIHLRRMAIEIRDALLHLRPYLPAVPGGQSTPENGTSSGTADYALRLAQAIHARKAGGPPKSSEGVPGWMLAAQDFDSDLRHLLNLARVWPSARAAVAEHAEVSNSGAGR